MNHFPLQIIIEQQQSQLLNQLQESQRQQQELQRRLQEQLNGITQQPFPEPQVPQLPTQFKLQEAIVFPLEPPPPPCSTLSGEAGLCRPLDKCITFYAQVPELRRQPCRLQGQELGVCCPLKKRPSGEHITQVLQLFI
jgi:peroxidase